MTTIPFSSPFPPRVSLFLVFIDFARFGVFFNFVKVVRYLTLSRSLTSSVIRSTLRGMRKRDGGKDLIAVVDFR